MGSERPSEWIFDAEAMTLHCRECGETFKFDDLDEVLDFKEYARYCLHCGAWMHGRGNRRRNLKRRGGAGNDAE